MSKNALYGWTLALVGALCLFVVAFTMQPAFRQEPSLPAAQVAPVMDQFDKELYKELVPLVCKISIYDKDELIGWGTGWKCKLGQDVWIVSAGHMVLDGGGGSTRSVMVKPEYTYQAQFVGVEPPLALEVAKVNHAKDVAIFKTSDKRLGTGGLTMAVFDPEIGDDCYMLGNPLIYRNVYGKGIITGIDGDMLMTNIQIIFGNSGGAVLSKDKYVIGLVSAVATSRGQFYPHLGFLVRVSDIRKEFKGL